MTKSRTTRDEETRDAEIMEEWGYESANPFDIPAGVQREGFDYHYTRFSVRGERDHRVEELMGKGWKLVPASRCSDKNRYIDPLSDNSLSKDYIIKRDLILMERPSIFSKREKENLERSQEQKTRALPGLSAATSDITMRAQYRNHF